MKGKRRRINKKRLSISISVLIISLVLTTKISLKHAAENYNKDEKAKEETPILEEVESNIEEKEEVEPSSTKEELDIAKSKDENKNENLKDKSKVDEDTEMKDNNNPKEYDKIFQKDLFLGDSITDSLSYYEFIDKENVHAKLGFTTKKALNEIQEIIDKNPENIYILFGMNDMETFRDTEKFIMYYKELIDAIQNKLPNTTIYIQSILPVMPKVKDKEPFLTNENIDIFNQSIKDMTEKENIEYLNISEIVENNMDLFEPDGIHMKYKFYKLWLEYLTDNTK